MKYKQELSLLLLSWMFATWRILNLKIPETTSGKMIYSVHILISIHFYKKIKVDKNFWLVSPIILTTKRFVN